ncbi:hypothetical protein GALL_494340 [mine drainage metagenome]|uniref:Uncharacterized protein n=1 Tax=mine drainage metagenome TaxID=410659 RepID=A0A1J5PBD2_9ZZZZ
MLEKVLRRGAPVDDAPGHDLVLAREVDQIVERADGFRRIEERRRAVRGGQPGLAVFDRQALEQPVGEARGRNLQPPVGRAGRVVQLGEAAGEIAHLVPVRRGLFGVETNGLECLLVPVEHGSGPLERHAPGLAGELGIGHERGVEALEPGGIALDQIFRRDQHALVEQGEDVHGQRHGHFGGVGTAAAQRREGLGDGVLIAAGVDGLDHDIGVGLVEFGGIAIENLGDRPADGDRVIHRQFDDICGMGHRQCGAQQGNGGSLQEIATLHG